MDCINVLKSLRRLEMIVNSHLDKDQKFLVDYQFSNVLSAQSETAKNGDLHRLPSFKTLTGEDK